MRPGKFALILPAASLVSVILPSGAAAQSKEKDKRLNIIHIMSDDHSYQTISAYGHPLSKHAPTPNIDRLAAEGVTFDRAYVENSVSTPSRACLMTGLYSHQNGQTMLSNVMDTTVTFVGQLLQSAGYQTAVIGKWHMLCEPKGFDYYRVLRGQGYYYRPLMKTAETDGQYIPETGYVTDVITQHAIEFLENRDPDKPFCLYVHHKAPHRTWEPDLKYLDLYEDEEFPVPDNFFEDYSGRGAAFAEQRMSVEKNMFMYYDLKVYGWEGPEAPTFSPQMAKNILPPARPEGMTDDQYLKLTSPFGMTIEQARQWHESFDNKNRSLLEGWQNMTPQELALWKYQRYIKNYLRVIKSVDDSVGEILDYLEAHDLMDNTVIVYTSDQGFYMGEHGLFDKRFMYEESYRTPLLIRYPGNSGGGRAEALVQNLDFAPTYLDIAGVEKPENMSGESLVPILKHNGKAPLRWRKYLYYHFYDHTAEHNALRHDGISDKRYKLIHFYDETGKITAYDEFYDLKADPSEMRNVIDERKYSRLVKKFNKKLQKMRDQLGVQEY